MVVCWKGLLGKQRNGANKWEYIRFQCIERYIVRMMTEPGRFTVPVDIFVVAAGNMFMEDVLPAQAANMTDRK
jgi:hypothetical protein